MSSLSAFSEHGVELLRGHEDGTRLRPFGWTDDATPLQQVHETAGPGEPDAELALQHRRRTELRPHHQLHGLHEHFVVIIVASRTNGFPGDVVALHAFDVLRLRCLPAPVGDDLAYLILAYPWSLDAPGHVRR